jgi:translation initiation factor IF-3
MKLTDRIESFDKSKKIRRKENWYNEEDDSRMNIMPNGNEGTHYENENNNLKIYIKTTSLKKQN